jgi:glycosyltransferase involved in cell wall biosynthesis
MKAKFTIFVPVHNGGEHLKRCVESVLAQTLQDYHLVVLENGSTDGSREWLATVRDPRVSVLPSERLLPIEENWGRALALPKNELMTIFGHDDLMDPAYLAVMDAVVRRHPEAGLYFAHFRYVDEAGKVLRSCRPLPERETAAEYLHGLYTRQRDTYGTGYLYRSARYEAVGGMPRWRHLVFADDALWLKLMEGSWKATAPEQCFGIRVHRERYGERARWRDWAEGLAPYLAFLQAAAHRDPSLAKALAAHGPAYFLEWCNSLYESALVEASKRNQRLDPEDVSMLKDAIQKIAPAKWPQYHGNPRFRFRRRRELLNRFRLPRWLYYQYRRLRYPSELPAG